MGYNSSAEAEDTHFVQILDEGYWQPHAGPMTASEATEEAASIAMRWAVRTRISQTPYPEAADA